MQKRNILIPIAVSVMLLPMTVNAAAVRHSAPPAYASTHAIPSAYADRAAEAAVLQMVNDFRTQHGLNALRRSAELDRAAAVRASELAQKFSHTRPDGSRWSTVSGLALGENIAMGHRTAEKTMLSWMNSSGHRANILRSGYASIGIAAAEINGIRYWVQLFGK